MRFAGESVSVLARTDTDSPQLSLYSAVHMQNVTFLGILTAVAFLSEKQTGVRCVSVKRVGPEVPHWEQEAG